MITLEVGDTLTFRSDIINNSGQIYFKKGDKAIVSEILKSGGYYGKVSGYWMDEYILGIKIEGHYGIWHLETFEELSK
jgi:hypothetical protein